MYVISLYIGAAIAFVGLFSVPFSTRSEVRRKLLLLVMVGAYIALPGVVNSLETHFEVNPADNTLIGAGKLFSIALAAVGVFGSLREWNKSLTAEKS